MMMEITPRDEEALRKVRAALPHVDPDDIYNALLAAHLIGSHHVSDWAKCRCGKEYYVSARESSAALASAHVQVKKMSMCRVCEARTMQQINHCPGSTERGACKLAYDHTGRCEPDDPTPEFIYRVAAANTGHGVPVFADNPTCACGHLYALHATKGLKCERPDCDCKGFAKEDRGDTEDS